ncbi:MAG: hypothetical protein LBG45_03390 [Dysgonamonadaceae bacterium]|nr:hypothetical protein [Dysgonamonadaceae bacterium]
MFRISNRHIYSCPCRDFHTKVLPVQAIGKRMPYTAFLSFLPEITGSNEGYLLKNIVFLELCRRRARDNFDIYYYNNHCEIDFVIAKSGNIQQFIQVSLSLENEKTRKREISALLKSADELHCNSLKIITQGEKTTILENGKKIEAVSVIDWLCER